MLGWGWGSPWPPAYGPRLGIIGQGGHRSWVSAALASAHPTLSRFFFGGGLHQEACGILVPWPGVEPGPSAVEGAVLTSGLPGNSPQGTFLPAKFICSEFAKCAAVIPISHAPRSARSCLTLPLVSLRCCHFFCLLFLTSLQPQFPY